MADIARQGDQEVRIVDETTQDAAGVTATKRLKVDIEGSAETSLKLGTRLKIYEETITTGASPKTFNIKSDMDTKFSVSNSEVRFLQIIPVKPITVKVNGDTEAITVKKEEVFNLNNFDITSIIITVTSNTDIRILAEGLAEVS